MTNSDLEKPTNSVMFYGSDWYNGLVDEVHSTLTEAVFNSRMTLIEGYHAVGKLLREHEDQAPMTELVNSCAADMGVSSRKLWYAVQFYDTYPDLNDLPDGKNISWSKIKTKYLPQTTRETPEKEKEVCPTCGREL